MRSIATLAVLLATAAAAQTIPPRLTLDEAVRLAAAHRRELTAADAAVRAREGAAVQASLRPNPVFYVQSENWRAWQSPGLAPGRDLEIFAYVSDTIETAGKRRLRGEFARGVTHTTELEREATAWAIRRAVSEAWWRARGYVERQALLERSREPIVELVRYQQNRLDQGAIAAVELLKMRVEDERLAAAATAAAVDAEQARLALLAEVGLPEGGDFELAGDEAWEELGAPAAPADAIRLALEHRPDLAVERAAVEAARALVGLERAQAKPNVQPYFGYKRATGFDTLVGGVTVPLALRDRNQGRIAEVEAETARGEAVAAAATARVVADVRAAQSEASRRRALAEALRDGVRRDAAETFRIAYAVFREQGFDLLMLIDAHRAQVEADLLLHQALLDYRLSRERLAAATGYAIPAR